MSSLRNNYSEISEQRRTGLTRGLSEDGLNTNYNAIGDYSVTPVEFFVQPPVNFDYFISEIILEVADNAQLAQNRYGGIPALPIGIEFFVERNGERNTLTEPNFIKTNGELLSRSNGFDIVQFDGGIDAIIYRLDLSLIANPTWLNGDTNDKFGVTLNDDFTALPFHQFSVLGSTQGPKART